MQDVTAIFWIGLFWAVEAELAASKLLCAAGIAVQLLLKVMNKSSAFSSAISSSIPKRAKQVFKVLMAAEAVVWGWMLQLHIFGKVIHNQKICHWR